MKRRYVIVAVAVLVFLVVSAIWVDLVFYSGIGGAVRKLGRSEREFQQARSDLLFSSGDPVPAVVEHLDNPRTSRRARVHCLKILAGLSQHGSIASAAGSISRALADTSREMQMEALKAYASAKSFDGIQAVVELFVHAQDTEMITLSMDALRGGTQGTFTKMYGSFREGDTTALDSCYRLLREIPVVSGWAEGTMMYYHQSHGNSDSADAHFKAMGALQSWWALCSFDARGHSAFHKEYGPEQDGLDTTKFYPAGDGTINRWMRLQLRGRQHRVDLNNLFMPRYSGAAYFCTCVTVPSSRNALLCVDVDDGACVWVNDSLVFRGRRFGGPHPDLYTVPLELDAGTNRIMVKSVQDHTGGWSMACRLTDRRGRVMGDVVVGL